MRRHRATPEQIAKAKEKRAKVREIAKRIGAMSEDQRRALIHDWPTTIEGHRVSVHNACLLAYQGKATVIGGFRQWKKAGRYVRKGEHGLTIWIPLGLKKHEDPNTGEVSQDGERKGFGLATVFDVSQTEEATTQAQEHAETLEEVAA